MYAGSVQTMRNIDGHVRTRIADGLSGMASASLQRDGLKGLNPFASGTYRMSSRGRGRKAVASVPENTIVEASDAKPARGAGRGGRKKQFPVVAVVTSEGIEGNLQPEVRRPLIAHLPIQSRDVIFHDEPMKYDPRPPTDVEPFGSFADNPFSEQSEFVLANNEVVVASAPEGEKETARNAPAVASAPVKQETVDYYKKGELLVQFKQADEIRTIPETSSVACFWCCHTFEGRPVVLPTHDHGDHLSVFGNYCSPECAMAYLFDMRQDTHTRWEQLALLNRIYADAVGGRIHPAPARNVLTMFGGMYTIEEYRGLIRQKKVRVDVHLPPMMSILATMDTKPIDFYDVSLTKNVMDTVKERLEKAEEVLKLRRTKPLKAWESTLDACINLRVGVQARA